jgi:hypothetical protein
VVFDGFEKMSEDLRNELNSIKNTAGGFYAWGAEPRGHAGYKWRKMARGDYVLAYYGLARLLLALKWWYIIEGPIRTGDDLDPRIARFHFFRSFAIPLVFLSSIGISFLSVPLAISSWVLMFLADAAIWRLLRRRLRSSA